MNFYAKQHQFYAGIDLHARLLAICILDQAGHIVCQTKIPADKQILLDTLAPYRADVVVCVECLFAWYWVSDLCREQGIPFVLGHALSMRAIHGGSPAVRRLRENTPDRAVELLAEPEARQGRPRWRKLRQVSNYWDFEPAMLPCVLVPDLAGFDWPAARPPEYWTTDRA